MENFTTNDRKNINITPIINLSSNTSRKEPQDKLNCLSIDLQRLKKKDRILPKISTNRKDLINEITQKLRKIKQKIRQKTLQQTLIRRNNLTQQEKPDIVPIPLNYQIPFQMPYQIPYPFYNCGHPWHNCQNCNKKRPKKQRKNKKQKKPKQIKQIKVKKKNIFRICAYAIYFTIFLKYYSQRFTENRRNWSFDRYHRTVKTIIDKGSQKFHQKLMEIDIYQMSQECKQNRRIGGGTTNVDWEDYTNTALIPQGIEPQKASQNRYTVGQFIINFTQSFIQKLKNIIFDEQFLVQYHQVFSAGSMDQNFLLDNLYLPQQIPFLYIHPIKGYIRLGFQEEVQLLLMKLMIRMVIFNYLLSLHRFKDWNKRLQDKYRLQLSQRQQVWELGRILGVFLYMTTKQLYMQGIKNIKHETNFYEMRKKFAIHQAKSLQEQKNRPINQNQFELIKNIKDYDTIISRLQKNGKLMQYKQILKVKIIDYLSSLHTILKHQQRKLYQYIQNMTINTPYIIFQGIKKNKLQKQNKSNQYRVLKPNQQRLGRQWHKIYGDTNSMSNDKSSSRKVKFDDSVEKTSGRKTQTQGRSSLYQNQKQKNMNSTQNLRSSPMKKAFNYDTVNSKYDKNRQDRLQQKFRNLLIANNDQIPQP